mgnify:CR=1 FL=1
MRSQQWKDTRPFLSTLPARGATFGVRRLRDRRHISIHAPREGSDSGHFHTSPKRQRDFYPRSPRGERPMYDYRFSYLKPFLSTLPARGATVMRWVISTGRQFLSTLPARGATLRSRGKWHEYIYFYPRSPRGERRKIVQSFLFVLRFLSTLPARGATPTTWASPQARCGFLSTLPARGATHRAAEYAVRYPISIHAPREGSDGVIRAVHLDRPDFYPRSPRGERLPFSLRSVCRQ